VKLYFKLPDGSVVSESDAPAWLVQVLSAQLNTADDRVAAAAALVHTACAGSDAARLASCVSTLTKFVTNVKKDPAEPKYAVQLTCARNNNTDSHSHNNNTQSCGRTPSLSTLDFISKWHAPLFTSCLLRLPPTPPLNQCPSCIPYAMRWMPWW
jgi:hypothetical protein